MPVLMMMMMMCYMQELIWLIMMDACLTAVKREEEVAEGMVINQMRWSVFFCTNAPVDMDLVVYG